MREYRLPYLAFGILLLDQVTKALVQRCLPLDGERPLRVGALALTHVHNNGVALGWLEHAGALVLAASLASVVWLWLFWASLDAGGGTPASFAAGLACFLGGAAGNTMDRLRLGHVIDFLCLPNGLVINLADVAITLGVLLVCHAFWKAPRERLQTA